jgi:hypothetical protein
MWKMVALAALACFVGCGSASDGGVTGTVTLDGNPLKNASLRIMPTGETKGLGGVGKTDASGKFTLTSAQGGREIAPGTYKVVVNRPLRKDGSEPDPNVPPIESDATETLPPIFSDENQTTIKLTVTPDQKTYEIKLVTPKK